MTDNPTALDSATPATPAKARSFASSFPYLAFLSSLSSRARRAFLARASAASLVVASCGAVIFGGFSIASPRDANASVSIALSLEDLARASSVVARVTPLDRTSVWEDARIVTYTRVRVDDVIAGKTAAGAREVRIRSFGGSIGDIGQVVEGEPQLAPNQPCILFLAERNARVVVVGRAQGQFVVQRDTRGLERVRIRSVGALVERRVAPPLRGPAERVTERDGSPLETFVVDAKRAWEASHAP